jgi:alkylhydroperoxidase family enzyme
MTPVPRIRPVAEPDPEVAEVLSKTLTDARGAPLNIFATLANHPRLLKRLNVLGGLFLAHGLLPARDRELAIMRTAWRTRCEYEWGQHVIIGTRAGLTAEEVARLTRPETVDQWSPADRGLLQFVDEVLDNADVTESTWADQQQRWSEAQLLELVTLVGFYRMLAGFLNAVKVQLEDDLPGWPAAEHTTM